MFCHFSAKKEIFGNSIAWLAVAALVAVVKILFVVLGEIWSVERVEVGRKFFTVGPAREIDAMFVCGLTG